MTILSLLVQVEMENFDKRMALDVIEDALTTLNSQENCGFAQGLCGAFYLCGILSHAEWEAFLERIPGTPDFDAEICAASKHWLH